MSTQTTPAQRARGNAGIRLADALTHSFAEALFGTSIATLGLQLGWLAGLHIAISDVFLAAGLVVLLARQRSALVTALRLWTPLHTGAVAILVALLWGTSVAFIRTGTVISESLVNKDLGWLVFGAIVIVVRSLVSGPEEVARLLRYLLCGGLVVEAVGVIWFAVAVATGNKLQGLRFDGFLLNPNANGLFITVLLMLELASTLDPRIFPAPRWVRLVGVGFLLVLLLATLSRSSWVGAMGAFVLLGLTVMRKTPWIPFACALVLLAFSLQPLTTALAPVWTRISHGQLPASERTYETDATAPPGVVPLLNGITPAPSQSARPSSSPVAVPVTVQHPDYLSSAAEIAGERYGASDRLALDVLAVKLWLASPASAITGIGLGVFLQVTPFLFGVPVIIHSSYLWFPVEMGVPGIGALLLLVVIGYSIYRSSKKWDNGLAIAIVGSLLAVSFWSLSNEGIYQRVLWFSLALGATLTWPLAPVFRRSA